MISETNVGLGQEALLWWRLTGGHLSQEQLNSARTTFARGTVLRIALLIPDEIYRFTRVFLSAIVCWAAQICGMQAIAAPWMHSTNEEIISLSMHTLSRSYYSVGWIQPRAGLMINSLVRILHRSLSKVNKRQYEAMSYLPPDNRWDFPIDMNAFGNVLKAKGMRLVHTVQSLFAGGILLFEEYGEKVAPLRSWIDSARPLSRVARDHLSIPIYELAMFEHNRKQKTILKIARIVEWGIFKGGDIFSYLSGK
ncbi:MAG: hypothetical protein Q8K75_07975 [Chlamydiales bacterium]|nr:hypothetical protein [Chlamydiales bacterium]